ncbi:MAG: PepSY domain-containing protein, partial [Bacteroidota bacterium]
LRWTLTLGGIFGALIPIINGGTTGQWIWYSWAYGLDQILFIDLFWLVLSALSFITAFKLKKTEHQEKQPILRQAI